MWIVRLALRRPYTFVVAALLVLLMTPFVVTKTPTDIFPRNQHPGRQRDLELTPDCRQIRSPNEWFSGGARAHHHGR